VAWVHKVPAPALWLGLGGLLPFVGLALRAKLGSPEVHTTSLVGLLQYGALIITFVGALHWGYAVAGVAGRAPASLRYGWSVLPSLAAWWSLQLPLSAGLLLQAALLVACWLVDRVLLLPDARLAWMASLRMLLTCVAVASLVVAGLS